MSRPASITLPAVLALLGLATSCATRPPRDGCDGVACAAACPRDAARDGSGRCACATGSSLVLGACVPPSVADAYCGPAATFEADGCVFRGCDSAETVDVATGRCVPRSSVSGRQGVCAGEGHPIVAQRRAACVEAEALCPRGSRLASGANGANGAVCARPPRCPAGTLPVLDACRSLVTEGVRSGLPRVDIGAWATFVLGADGGPGSSYLCRPVMLRPETFGLTPGASASLGIRVTLFVPDEDVSRVHAETHAELLSDGGSHALSAEAEGVVASSVSTLLEPLRGLGGEASTAALEVRVDCKLASM